MPKFIVRQSCDYSIEIEASNAEEATEKASEIDMDEWDAAYSGLEADEEETT